MEKTTLNKTIYEYREEIESKNFELAQKKYLNIYINQRKKYPFLKEKEWLENKRYKYIVCHVRMV